MSEDYDVKHWHTWSDDSKHDYFLRLKERLSQSEAICEKMAEVLRECKSQCDEDLESLADEALAIYEQRDK